MLIKNLGIVLRQIENQEKKVKESREPLLPHWDCAEDDPSVDDTERAPAGQLFVCKLYFSLNAR